MISYQDYQDKKNKKSYSMDDWVNTLKNIYFFASGIAILLVTLFGFFDYLLFVHTFHFNYAVFKDFYLASFDFTMVNILSLIALLPVIIIVFIFFLPYVIVEVILNFQSLFNKLVLNSQFYIIFFILYFSVGLFNFWVVSLVADNYKDYTELIFFLPIFTYIITLGVSLWLAILISDKWNIENKRFKISSIIKNINEWAIIVYSIIIIPIALFYNSSITLMLILGLLLLTSFMPFILLMFLENKKTIIKNKKRLPALGKIVMGLVAIIFITIIINNMNNKQWKILNTDKQGVSQHGSLNLFLNRVYLCKP